MSSEDFKDPKNIDRFLKENTEIHQNSYHVDEQWNQIKDQIESRHFDHEQQPYRFKKSGLMALASLAAVLSFFIYNNQYQSSRNDEFSSNVVLEISIDDFFYFESTDESYDDLMQLTTL